MGVEFIMAISINWREQIRVAWLVGCMKSSDYQESTDPGAMVVEIDSPLTVRPEKALFVAVV